VVRREFGDIYVPGHSTCFLAVSALDDGGESYDWVAVMSLEGHAIFVGDACCRAFTVLQASASDSKIRENQICFGDEELVVVVLGDDAGGIYPVASSRTFRSLQSYDLRSKCVCTFQPCCEQTPIGTTKQTSVAAMGWQCVSMRRFVPQRHSTMTPPLVTHLGSQRLLWQLANCLGATQNPYYYFSGVPRWKDDAGSRPRATSLKSEREMTVTSSTSMGQARHGTTQRRPPRTKP
jgi:hypothetical protein